MNLDNLKTISANLKAVKGELKAIEKKIAEATTRRDGLLAEVQGIDAAIEGAELAHAAALAAVELGEPDNTAATAAALDISRAALSRKPELTQQRRMADAMIEGLTKRHLEAHGRYVALIEQHKAEQIDVVLEHCKQTMNAARESFAEFRNRITEAQAARFVLEDMGAGSRWDFGHIDINQFTIAPDQTAFTLFIGNIRRELEAA
ncbi:MAG: hypothetical protein LDL19_00190 [Thiobacillus sp.]|nr:hypothetical protein [Thiobacillus sp.]